MSRLLLTRVKIEGFRGINNQGAPLDLKLKGKAVNSISAANGLGKSSIFEALCYAIRGRVPKLDSLQASESPQDYYCNRFHPAQATILLELTPDDDGTPITIEVCRDKAGNRTVSSPSGHPDPNRVLQDLDEEYALLDYSTFSEFVNDSALARGRSFTALLGMRQISDYRQLLEQLSHATRLETDFGLNSLKSNRALLVKAVERAEADVNQAHHGLLGKNPTHPIDHASIVNEATTALKNIQLLAPLFADATLETVQFADVTQAIKKAEGSDARTELETAIKRIKLLEGISPNDKEAKELDDLRRTIAARDSALNKTRGPLSKMMYESVAAVLASDEWSDSHQCPVCTSSPETQTQQIVEQALKNYTDVSEAQTSIRSLWAAGSWQKRLNALETSLLDDPKDRTHARTAKAFEQGTPSEGDLSAAASRLAELGTIRDTALEELRTKRTQLEKELPPSLVALTEQVDYARELQTALSRHKKATSETSDLSSIEAKIATRESWIDFLKTASSTFANAEASLSKDQTASIASEYKDMYRAIVRNQQVLPSLSKPTSAEDLHLRLEKFFGLEDVAARPLLSESYRNAFAISVFLSAAVNKSAAPRFVVLDDITSSFDAGHQWNLMEEIRKRIAMPTNTNGLQVILLSHDGLLEKYFDTLSGRQDWHHQKLYGCPPTGAVHTQAEQANRLRAQADQLLSAGQTQQAEPLLRQYLEYKLLHIIKKVRIPVPIDFAMRGDRRMVSNCLTAIKDAVTLHESSGTLIMEESQKSSLRDTHIPTIIGNWVSHYETQSSTHLAPGALLAVLETIDDIADCFVFTDADGNQQYYKALDRRE